MLDIISIIIGGIAVLLIGFASCFYMVRFLKLLTQKLIIKTKLQKIKSHSVVLIKNLPSDLYWDTEQFIYLASELDIFAILTKQGQSKTYTLTIPFVDYNEYTQSVRLNYYSTTYNLNDVSNVKSLIKFGLKNNSKLTTVQPIAIIIKDHLQIKDEIEELRQRDSKINNLAKLLVASDIYTERLHKYETALIKIRNCSNKAEQLDKLYARLVREMLIGLKVAEEEVQHLPDRETSFDLQYQRIQEEYNFMKDEVSAYDELLQDSRNIRV